MKSAVERENAVNAWHTTETRNSFLAASFQRKEKEPTTGLTDVL